MTGLPTRRAARAARVRATGEHLPRFLDMRSRARTLQAVGECNKAREGGSNPSARPGYADVSGPPAGVGALPILRVL